jgi:hypothetical protein
MPDRRKCRPAPVKKKAGRRTAAIPVTDTAYQATAEVPFTFSLPLAGPPRTT